MYENDIDEQKRQQVFVDDMERLGYKCTRVQVTFLTSEKPSNFLEGLAAYIEDGYGIIADYRELENEVDIVDTSPTPELTDEELRDEEEQE